MKTLTHKKCGNTATARRSVSYVQRVEAENAFYSAFQNEAERLGCAFLSFDEAKGGEEGIAGALATGAVLHLFDEKRREVKMLTMSATGTFLQVCARVEVGAYEDRLMLSAVLMLGADLGNLAVVTNREEDRETEAERTYPCGCVVEPIGFLRDLAPLGGAARTSVLGALARRVLGFFDAETTPEESLDTKALRQIFQANPQVNTYDYALEGYAPQEAKRGKDLRGAVVLGW